MQHASTVHIHLHTETVNASPRFEWERREQDHACGRNPKRDKVEMMRASRPNGLPIDAQECDKGGASLPPRLENAIS